LPSQKRILDIGCGDGAFLNSLPVTFDKTGIDFTNIANPKFLFIKGGLEKLKLVKQYDLITLNHVIEHVDNPANFIKQVSQLQTPGSVLFISTPTTDSLGFKIAGKKWYHFDHPYHKTLFNKNKLTNLLTANNYVVIKAAGEFPGFPFDILHTLKNINPVLILLFPVMPILKLFIPETIMVVCKKL
jgi:2-polyprenyl-3-methyl-5-hydroxy-6-metoxy-1,4-benzoquinol methylase